MVKTKIAYKLKLQISVTVKSKVIATPISVAEFIRSETALVQIIEHTKTKKWYQFMKQHNQTCQWL